MELKRHSVRGVKYNGEEICGGFAYYDADEVDAFLAEKDKDIAYWREEYDKETQLTDALKDEIESLLSMLSYEEKLQLLEKLNES